MSNPNKIYWVHLDTLEYAEIERKAARLGLGATISSDLLNEKGIARSLYDETSLTVALHHWSHVNQAQPSEPSRLLIHLTERFCVTLADASIPALNKFAESYQREFRFAKTPGFILFLILDNMVEEYTEFLSEFDGMSESIDDRIHNDFNEGLNRDILQLKRRLITMKRAASSLRDILMRLSGRRIPVISESCRRSLVEIYNHSQVVVMELESLRELAGGSLDAYNSVMSHRLNDSMKILTLFSSVILPMSLIAGIYGMNFASMPELDWKFGYPFALILMGGCGASLLYFFKRKGWF